METYPYDAKRRVEALIEALKEATASDPEQEVQGIAVPVVAAALDSIKKAKSEDPVVRSLIDLFSADVIGADEPIRAVDMLLVAQQLDAAIGHYPAVVF